MTPESFPPDPSRAAAERKAREEAAWQAIVADLEPTMPTTAVPDITTALPASDPVIDALLADEPDYEPPEPPPLKAPADALARFAWAGVIGGPILALLAFVFGLGRMIGAIGIAAAFIGFVILMARLPHTRDHDDDGAVV